MRKHQRFGASASLLALLVVALLATPRGLRAQTPSRHPSTGQTALAVGAQQPKFKGIFEPINYNQDLTLLDAFFVTPTEGWVSGAAGTILHTRDAGATWTAQLGGDPQAQGPDITRLFFLDQKHGWAQGSLGQLFRTTDGENWQQVNNDVRRQNVVFTTATRGFYSYADKIYQTQDGGVTWKEVFTCVTQGVVQGLTQQITCGVDKLQFASPSVGYGVGTNNAVLGGGVVVKTEDAGMSWNVIFIPQEAGDQRTSIVSFLDENRGFVLRNSGMYQTSDGGKSWQGVAATLSGDSVPLKFADPEVGWLAAQLPANFTTARLTYTPDGGAHWLARDLHFPAVMHGFSLPRRDRGYVVGEHGMIYRYRVVPLTYQAAAHSIDAPAMPGFDSTVPREVAALSDIVTQLRVKLPAVASDPSQGAVPAGAFQQDTGASGFQQDTAASGFQQDAGAGPVADGYVNSCCGPLIQQLDTNANAFATNAPTFSQRFRSLNLIFDGLSFLNSVVNQANALKQSIRALRQAPNAQAASAALNTVQAQVNGISSAGGFVQDTSLPQL